MRKYGESKATRIMMATVPHVTSGSGLIRADGFLLDRMYVPPGQCVGALLNEPCVTDTKMKVTVCDRQ